MNQPTLPANKLSSIVKRKLVWCAAYAALLSVGRAAPISKGPAVGARIPDFSLSDQTGRKQSLATIAGPKGAMLVFYRSADW